MTPTKRAETLRLLDELEAIVNDTGDKKRQVEAASPDPLLQEAPKTDTRVRVTV